MLLAAFRDEVELRVLALGPLDEAAEGGTLEVREMGAGEETDQIGGGEDGPAVKELHRARWYGASVSAHLARERSPRAGEPTWLLDDGRCGLDVDAVSGLVIGGLVVAGVHHQRGREHDVRVAP